MQIAVLEGYRIPRRSKMARRRGGVSPARRKKMKSCAKRHKVTSKGFWSCVRGAKKKSTRKRRR